MHEVVHYQRTATGPYRSHHSHNTLTMRTSLLAVLRFLIEPRAMHAKLHSRR